MDQLPSSLIGFLQNFVHLTEAELLLLSDKMEPRSLNKGDYFIKQGQVCNQVGFLVKGIMRVYHIANDKEYTSYFNFGTRNQFVSSFSSFITRKPSEENIHALEDCELLVITYESLQHLYETGKGFERLGRLIAEFNYVLAMQRIYSLQHQSAQERYNQLLQIYPNLINRVPHHFVASYLGVTPESLSRIRKNK